MVFISFEKCLCINSLDGFGGIWLCVIKCRFGILVCLIIFLSFNLLDKKLFKLFFYFLLKVFCK